MKVIPERFVRNCVLLAHKRLGHGESLKSVLSNLIHDVYAMGAAAEREACAALCDKISDDDGFEGGYADNCAKAIRARGQG